MITWRGRGAPGEMPEQYDTRGASVRLTAAGWFLFWMPERGRLLARGPFQGGLEAAMDCWAEINRKQKDGDEAA